MKISLTQRDKKLLTFLGVFVIIVLVGYYGILPQIKAVGECKDDIEEQELLRDIYDQKIVQLVGVEINNDELETLISGAKDNYYPMMDADAVDHMITNKVIDEYGLMAYDLTIEEKELASLQPYVYSKKALTGESDAYERALAAAAPVISEEGITMFAEVAEADSETTGIYMVAVTMRLGGDMNDIERLLDDLAYSEKKIRLVDYSVESEVITIPHDDGTEEVFDNDSLNLKVELYMCEE